VNCVHARTNQISSIELPVVLQAGNYSKAAVTHSIGLVRLGGLPQPPAPWPLSLRSLTLSSKLSSNPKRVPWLGVLFVTTTARRYCRSSPRRRSSAKLLTKDEARRIATNVAKLPGLLRNA
jgi:hypothetical protein